MADKDRTAKLLSPSKSKPLFSFKDFLQPQTVQAARYILVVVVLILALLAILIRTSMLQFSKLEYQQLALTRGSGGTMTVQAPRGDILDKSGNPIAYSKFSDSLYFTYTGLATADLNRCLLELANLLAKHQIEVTSRLTEYFDVAEQDKNKSGTSPLRFVFKKQLPEIKAWQQNKDLFNLAREDSKETRRLKTIVDPAVFYQYLLQNAFKVELEAQDALLYTPNEAWAIIKLRYTLLEHNWSFLQGEPVKLASDIPSAVKAAVQEQNRRYQGAIVRRESQRCYSEDSRYFAHALGYVGAISANEYENLKGYGYHLNDIVGKAGVEYSAERYLHGENGTVPYGSWVNSDTSAAYEEGYGGVAPQTGATIQLSLDTKMQKVLHASLYKALEHVREHKLGAGKSATAVMLQAKTGEIIAMGSIPSYNPLDFLNMAGDKEAAARVASDLTDSTHKPMLNRCISEIYAPGSTFKPISAAAALMGGVISAGKDRYECKGTEEIGYKSWVCYGEPEVGHGSISLREALVYSCNLYFFKMAIDTGIETIATWAQKLGLGEYTGIDLPGEARGIRPDPAVKARTRSSPPDQEWYPADTCQTSIGQFDNAYTPLQLVRSIAAVATNNLLTPHVIKSIHDSSGTLLREEQIENEQVGLSESCLALIKDGMSQLKYYEKSNNVFKNFSSYPVDVSAKTGTAEVGFDGKSTIALFVAFAPTDDPEVVIACIVEQGGKGDSSSNIARDLLDAYFALPPRPELTDMLQRLESTAFADFAADYATALQEMAEKEDEEP